MYLIAHFSHFKIMHLIFNDQKYVTATKKVMIRRHIRQELTQNFPRQPQ